MYLQSILLLSLTENRQAAQLAAIFTSGVMLFEKVLFLVMTGLLSVLKLQVFFINCGKICHFEPFLKDFIYLILERGTEGEKHQCVVALHTPPYWGPGL